MKYPDMTSRASALTIILGMWVVLFVATFWSYLDPHCPDSWRQYLTGALTGSTSNLMLALHITNQDPKDPQHPISVG